MIFIDFFRRHLSYKLNNHVLGNTPEKINQVEQRLKKTINILVFVVAYYSQFEEKLHETIKALDSEARRKVTDLISIDKWTVQKFDQVRSNVDSKHK